MHNQSPPFVGHNGFVWFFGTVEDREDPLQLGRVKVRVLNKHSEEITVDDLPWALPVQHIVSSALNGIGVAPVGLQVGSFVFGFFVDGEDSQQPVVLGSVAAMNNGTSDVSAQATGTDTISKSTVGPEPASAYAAQYPFNKVTTTEGGHVIELDDTPGAERIHAYHKSGSYVEIFPDGNLVIKSVGNKYNITATDLIDYAGGNHTVEVGGDQTQTIGGSQTVDAGSDQTMSAGSDQTFEAGSEQNFKPGGDFKVNAGGKVDLKGTSMLWNGQPLVLASGAITGGSF